MSKIVEYLKDSKHELLHEVTWPTTQELFNSAMVVISASVIISVVIFGIDELFGHLIIESLYKLFV